MQNSGSLAYWVTYPITLLECLLMSLVAALGYGIWRLRYLDLWHPQHARQRPRSTIKPRIDAGNALAVMQALERIAGQCQVRLFWISGTLLGLERLGHPLPHDTDMDAGVFVDDPRLPEFIRALQASPDVVALAPQFISMKVRIQNPDLRVVRGGIIRYKSMVRSPDAPHLPPVKTDIFLHFDYFGGSMHGSRNSLWWNSPFSIVQKTYQGGTFSVPADTHRHLSENYGDYSREVRDFENSIDCPNAMNIFSWASLAYLLRRQQVMLKLGRPDRAAQVGRRLRATILKGAWPRSVRGPQPHLGS